MTTAILNSGQAFSFFDANHWQRVREARIAQGLPTIRTIEGILRGHPLTGRNMATEDGHIFYIKEVRREWNQGYKTIVTFVDDQGLEYRSTATAHDIERYLAAAEGYESSLRA